MRCGTALGQGDDQTRGTDCRLDVGVAQLNAHLDELLLDLLHRLSRRDHGGAEVSQQGAGLGCVALVSGTGWGHHGSVPRRAGSGVSAGILVVAVRLDR